MRENLYSDSLVLHPLPPFDFSKSLAFLCAFPLMAGEQAITGDTLTKAVCYAGQPYAFRVRSNGTVEQPQLDLTLYSAQPLDSTVRAALADRVSFFLSLEDNLRPFYAIAGQDPRFAPLLEALYGYHQVKFTTPFENAAWAVFSQRAYRNEARQMKTALLQAYGCRLVLDGVEYVAFPEPDQVLAIPDTKLFELVGRNERKVEYLKSAAAAFATVDETFLRAADYAAVKEWLLGIRGIGAWSASFILIRGLGRMEGITRQERALLEAVQRVYGEKLDWDAVERLAEGYRPYQGYWAHYLRAASSMSNFCF